MGVPYDSLGRLPSTARTSSWVGFSTTTSRSWKTRLRFLLDLGSFVLTAMILVYHACQPMIFALRVPSARGTAHSVDVHGSMAHKPAPRHTHCALPSSSHSPHT